MPPALTASRWITSWTFDLPVVALVLLAGVLYLLLAARRPDWPVLRTVSFLSGLALVLVATCSFLGVYNRTLFWALSVQDVLLLALIPIPLVLGHPVALVRTTTSSGRRRSGLLGSLAGVSLLLSIYLTGLDAERLSHPALLFAVQVALVCAGCAFLGPLLGVAGVSYGVKVAIAFLDGLLDALPGLAVLGSHGAIAASYYAAHTRSWGPSPAQDQQFGGTAMVALSELVGIPALLALMILWVRSDAREAVVTDRVLDATPVPSVTPELHRPWWEVDAGPLADRVAREDWTSS